MLVQRAKQMALELPQARRSSYGLLDATDRAMDLYRVIAGICGEALERAADDAAAREPRTPLMSPKRCSRLPASVRQSTRPTATRRNNAVCVTAAGVRCTTSLKRPSAKDGRCARNGPGSGRRGGRGQSHEHGHRSLCYLTFMLCVLLAGYDQRRLCVLVLPARGETREPPACPDAGPRQGGQQSQRSTDLRRTGRWAPALCQRQRGRAGVSRHHHARRQSANRATGGRGTSRPPSC